MRVVIAACVGLLLGSVTGFLIAIVMVTFSVKEIPDWTVGVWFLWSLSGAVAAYFYLRRRSLNGWF